MATVLTNVLKPKLPNKMKQGAMKSIGAPLPQGKPESTNKKTGGFFKPVVKRRAAVLSSNNRTRNFSFFADFSETANFYNLTGNVNYDQHYLTDDELIKLSPAQILKLEEDRAKQARLNRIRESANRRANYRAVLDSSRELRTTLKSGSSILEPIGQLITNTSY